MTFSDESEGVLATILGVTFLEFYRFLVKKEGIAMKLKPIKAAIILVLFLIFIFLPISALAEIEVYDSTNKYLGVLISDSSSGGELSESPSVTEIFIPSICKVAILYGVERNAAQYQRLPREDWEPQMIYYDNSKCTGTKYYHRSSILPNHLYRDTEKFAFVERDLRMPNPDPGDPTTIYYLECPDEFCDCLATYGSDTNNYRNLYYSAKEILDAPVSYPIINPIRFRYNQRLVIGPDNCE